MYYATESDIWFKSYDNLKFSRASVVQFRTSRYITSQIRTSDLKVMTIWNSRELPLFNFELLYMWCPKSVIGVKSYTIWISQELSLFNFERLDILCAWISPLCEMLWPFEFLESFRCSISNVSICDARKLDIRVKSYDHLNFSRSFVVQFRASRYIMRLNRTSEWKVMIIWISRGLPLYNFARVDILCAWIRHPCEMLWPFEFLESFQCSILSVSICYAPKSVLRC